MLKNDVLNTNAEDEAEEDYVRNLLLNQASWVRELRDATPFDGERAAEAMAAVKKETDLAAAGLPPPAPPCFPKGLSKLPVRVGTQSHTKPLVEKHI